MAHWKTILTYDGTPFHGWQVQPGLPTVQEALARAIRRVTGETVLPQGSGRTDTGVHALGQVASFSLDALIPATNLHRALNRVLPGSIRILSLEEVPPSFHARHSAVRKTYEYRLFPHASGVRGGIDLICAPMRAPFVWDCRWPLRFERMQQAAGYVVGTHDFTSFAATDPDLAMRSAQAAHQPPVHATNMRTVFSSAWHREEDLLVYRVTGSGFLHHMVRNLVGTFVEIGFGRIEAESIPAILAACNRSAAGSTAPARGLFLVEVEY